MEKYTVETATGAKEYIVELEDKTDKTCALQEFNRALEFVAETSEFTTAQLQRNLKCGYGTVTKVIDALCALCVIEIAEETPRKYKRII